MSKDSNSRKLTHRQQKFVQGKLAGKSSRKAALEAGYSPSVADKANELINESPTVKAALTDLLESAGVTDRLLAQRIREGLDAMETKLAISGGKITAQRRFVDWSQRREMVELVLRLKGYLVNKHHVNAGPTLEELLEGSMR